jgi:hypothetical protein
MLTDLDAQLMRIRDYRTRTYFSDALKCFRAGAFRSAVAATWVTVAYDLIAKYRELSSLGDAEATRFIFAWDQARIANQTARLLELERTLLTHAHERMAIIDAMTLRALNRLYEDRHLCAHPAFANQDDLYEPPADLARAHMAVAVESLLSQPPIQGKSFFEAFSVDILSPGFPSTSNLVHDYVEHKYLRTMRPNVVRNFGVVLAKSATRNVPAEWGVVSGKVLSSLAGLQQRAAGNWPEIEAELLRLINDDDPPSRPRAVFVLSNFPHLAARINPPTVLALRQTCGNPDTLRNFPLMLAAADLPEFVNDLVPQFEALDDAAAATMLSTVTPQALWSNSLHRFSQAGSFRGAEARFDQFIAPFVSLLNNQQLSELFAAVQGNGQIWDAGGIPNRIFELLKAVQPRRPSDQAVADLYRDLIRRNRDTYEDSWSHMERLGWQRPQLRQQPDEDPFAN